ncbi:MAG: hypothetical protein NXH70_16190 [Hyphomonas sp.]|nr:hypothetical protein [Hyphomonas sp.]
MKYVPVSKIEDQELPVPSAWRPALKALADAMVGKAVLHSIEGFVINAIEDDGLEVSRSNVEAYPDKLGPLTKDSWKSSIYVWDDGCWEVLVDLTTEAGDVSDLVMHAKVTEREGGYLIEPGLIYVP